MSTLQKIAELEAEYARTQKNKATNFHLGLIKAKLAKLRRELIEPQGGGGGKGGEGFDVAKSGDTRVGLVGFPSVGKSTLLTKLTGTFSEAAAYEFTTLTAIPGTLHYRGARIQVVDLPGIIEGAKDGKGRGRQVISAARTCNIILVVLDVAKPATHKILIERELDGFGIRLNQEPPRIMFRKKEKGGINYQAFVQQTTLDSESVAAICKEYRIHNADVHLRCDATVDQVGGWLVVWFGVGVGFGRCGWGGYVCEVRFNSFLHPRPPVPTHAQLIDVIEGNRKYMPAVYVLNKIDQITIEELDIIARLPHCVPISAAHGWNLDELIDKVWDECKMIRIYTKPKGQIPDYTSPVILHSHHPSVEDFCNRIHRGLMANFKYAWVWGSSVKHQPQRVGKEHILNDEDVVQIVKKVGS